MHTLLRTLANYGGQLRLYTFLDLLVFATALTRNPSSILGIASLWISFLLYLESRHRDKPRLPINPLAWVAPFILSLFLLPWWMCFSFAVISYCYTKKTQHWVWGISAPLWRALQSGVIAVGFNVYLAALSVLLTFIRNLVGDFRDAHDDHKRNITTIPVILGVRKNQRWAFYGHCGLVVCTTIIWFHFSFLSKTLLLPIILLQLLSYPLTPRLSNPSYLNIYKKDQ